MVATDDERRAVMKLAHQHLAKDDALGWFEALYAQSDTSGKGVPWANMTPNPFLLSWLEDNEIVAIGRKTLVVGCGLGDDAEALSHHGCVVTAFDVSASAIALCKQRFADTSVDYQVADLFDPPQAWAQSFDFVYESVTVQALPPQLQERAMRQIAGFVAPGGHLLAMTWARPADVEPKGPPWPPAIGVPQTYLEAGLRQLDYQQTPVQDEPPLWHLRIVFERANLAV
ncbi:MAG: methyltransferase domain-containing protein [Chloroflexi bacterium]|nr:MAG: methyltransferase domain-containing protein [Chloroflexota bacterium]